MQSEETNNIIVQPADRKKIMGIWKVAGILAVVTAIEFGFAFGMGAGATRTTIFIALTIVKAYYIVSEFMHLGHEVKSLIWSIIGPMLFVVWLIAVLIYEGGAILLVR
ncbi:cytochrome C oxidase subunit IV family protein [Fulvivirgaceae bacterium BMA10]|uniref:Cytochrome C oxidase subunit IV family protein n=1 Tax=Splendidivirga corallicola TaxID=3051826 RepID=A0ABT8KQ05_9BACT|nr:cytochrome C oxidase subunit IV family protein [Fulvivirgaceae bacterium BMA10]